MAAAISVHESYVDAMAVDASISFFIAFFFYSERGFEMSGFYYIGLVVR